MAVSSMPIYTSPNGDRWTLLADSKAEQQIVRHDANEASGGHITYKAVDDFLSENGAGPEYSALRVLLNQLAETEDQG